ELSENLVRFAGIDQNIFLNNQDVFAQNATESEPSQTSHSACIANCREQYIDEDGNKLRGFGACRFNCWVDTAIRILEAVAPIVAAL
ncbi:MAG: hypothetical protein ACK4UK_01805, partial [Flavobacterium sp.]